MLDAIGTFDAMQQLPKPHVEIPAFFKADLVTVKVRLDTKQSYPYDYFQYISSCANFAQMMV